MSEDSFDGLNKRSKLPVLVLFVVTGLVAVMGIVLVIRFAREALNGGPKHIAYIQAIDDAKRAGIPVTPELLQAPLPSADKNAGPIYTQLTDLLAAQPLSAGDAIADLSSSSQMPSFRQFEQIRHALKHRSDVMLLVHRATVRPECVFVRDWSDPIAVAFKELKTIRSASRLLASESLLLAHDVKPLDAVRNLALGFKIARHVENENQLLSYLVAVAVDSITIAGLQKTLYLSDGNPTVAAAVRKVIESDWRPRNLTRTIRSETGMHIVELQVLRKQGPGSLNQFLGDGTTKPVSMPPARWNSFIDENGIVLLKSERSILASGELPYLKSAPTLHAIDSGMEADTNPQHLLNAILYYGYENTFRRQAQSVDIAEITRASAAVLAYRGRHGAFPMQLADALKPDNVPVDPFDDKPLRYIREDKGFVIYSTGSDGAFNGGTPGRVKGRYDVLFRYPLPGYYAKEMSEK